MHRLRRFDFIVVIGAYLCDNRPFDVVLFSFVFQLPNMFREFSAVAVFLMLERTGVLIKS